MKPLSVFLQAGSRVNFKTWARLAFNIADPTITGITATDEFTVISYKNGEKETATYPAGTTSVSVLADKDTDIILSGAISQLSFSTSLYLTKIVASGADFSDISATYCPILSTVNVSACRALSSLTVSNCGMVQSLSGSIPNSLTSLNLSSSAAITAVPLDNMQALQTLDMSYCTSVRAVDFSGCPNLETLNMSSCNAITSVDFSPLTKLVTLQVSDMLALLSADFTPLVSLETLSANTSYIDTIDVTSCVKLVTLNVLSPKGVHSVNASGISTLKTVYMTAYGAQSPIGISVDLSNCVALENAGLNGANISELNIDGSNAIKLLKLENASLTALDIEEKELLNDLEISNCTELAGAIDFHNASAVTVVRFNNTPKVTAYRYPTTTYSLQISLQPGNGNVMEELDMGGLTNINSFSVNSSAHLRLYKVRPIKNQTVANQMAALITNSGVNDGVVYLNSEDAYYQTVADAATAKGWTIEPLA